jgi:pyruvate/2-oxoglutarate dehydrogenase complex dihydrolipoamide acyltransferase (E2) component
MPELDTDDGFASEAEREQKSHRKSYRQGGYRLSLKRSGQEADERTLSEQEYNGYVVDRGEQPDRDISDLVLDVPVLKVDELDLEVEELRAHVSLRAEVADLVKINVGVDVYLNEVKLGIKGVEAQALLTVKLQQVLGTLNRALEAISRNPQILGGSFQNVSNDPTGEVYATNAARRKARELGVRLSDVNGTGSGGRILVRDVQKAAR